MVNHGVKARRRVERQGRAAGSARSSDAGDRLMLVNHGVKVRRGVERQGRAAGGARSSDAGGRPVLVKPWRESPAGVERQVRAADGVRSPATDSRLWGRPSLKADTGQAHGRDGQQAGLRIGGRSWQWAFLGQRHRGIRQSSLAVPRATVARRNFDPMTEKRARLPVRKTGSFKQAAFFAQNTAGKPVAARSPGKRRGRDVVLLQGLTGKPTRDYRITSQPI